MDNFSKQITPYILGAAGGFIVSHFASNWKRYLRFLETPLFTPEYMRLRDMEQHVKNRIEALLDIDRRYISYSSNLEFFADSDIVQYCFSTDRENWMVSMNKFLDLVDENRVYGHVRQCDCNNVRMPLEYEIVICRECLRPVLTTELYTVMENVQLEPFFMVRETEQIWHQAGDDQWNEYGDPGYGNLDERDDHGLPPEPDFVRAMREDYRGGRAGFEPDEEDRWSHDSFERHALVDINLNTTNTAPLYKNLFVDKWTHKVQAKIQQEQYVTELVDWGLTAMSLAENPSTFNFLVSVLRHMNRIFGMKLITEGFVKYIGIAFQALRGVAQPITSPVTSIFTRNNIEWISQSSKVMSTLTELLTTLGENVEMIAATISAMVVTIAAIVMGKGMLKSPAPLLERIGKMGLSMSGVNRGLKAAVEMIGNLKNWIVDAIGYIIGRTLEDKIMSSIMLYPMNDTDEFKKENLFEYIEYLLHPKNIDEITATAEKRDLLENTLSVVAGVLRINAEKNTLGNKGEKILWDHMKSLLKIRETAFRHSMLDSTRMTPYWINIVGPAGTGKSTLMTKMANNILNVLSKDAKYAIPATNAQRLFPVNFTDKYLVGYAQQYAMTVDDIFQEAPGQLDVSSALSMITWISSVPHRTVQADLASKGSPFNTKLIFTTSNMMVPRRPEIMCQSALLDRMRFVLKVDFHPEVCVNCRKRSAYYCDKCMALKDPDCDIPVIFERYTLDERKSDFVNPQRLTMREVYAHILKEYSLWFDKEHNLMQSSKGDDKMVDELAQQLFERNSEESDLFFDPHENLPYQNVPLSYLDKITRIVSDPLKWWRSEQAQLEKIRLTTSLGESKELFIFDDDREMVNKAFLSEVYYNLTGKRHVEDWIGGQIGVKHLTLANRFKIAFNEIKERLLSLPAWHAFSVLVVSIASWQIYKSWKCPTGHQDPFNVKYSNSQPQRIAPKKVTLVRNEADDFYPVTEDSQASDMINSLLNNAGQVFVQAELEGKISACTAIRPCGRWILFNRHSISKWKQGTLFKVRLSYRDNEKIVQQKFDPSKVRFVGKRDMALYECDLSMPCARNIMEHFLDDEIDAGAMRVKVLTSHPSQAIIPNLITTMKTTEIGDITQDDKVNVLLKLWSVPYKMVHGQSGSLLVADNTKQKQKLIGFHIGSVGQESYFEPLVRSELRSIISVEETFEFPLPEIDGVTPAGFGRNAMLYVGKTSKAVSQSKKSKIIQSAIHDLKSVYKYPSVLHAKDERQGDETYGVDTLLNNLKAYDKPVGVIDTLIFAAALSVMMVRYVGMSCLGVPRRILNNFEMVNGVWSYLQPLDMHTSPGYPWIHERSNKLNGKYEWFDEHIAPDGTKTYTMRENLLKVVEHRENEAKLGRRVKSASYACLKDETRVPEKIAAGKTRVFLCMPMDFNLLVRKYFGAFVATMHAVAGKMPSCVGIDAVTAWTPLVMRLERVGNNFEDFDYAGWDTSLHPEFFKGFVKVVNNWYKDGPENAKVRAVLIEELVYNFIIAKNHVFLKTAGTTSGCAITAELNSFIHDFLNIYYFVYINEKKNLAWSVDDYYQNVETAVYGDDGVKNVTQKFRWFNGGEIRPISMELGMDITPGNKSDRTFTFKPLSEITFLKRSFRKEGVIVRAPLDKRIINDITQWIVKSDNLWAATRLNCDVALREYAQYGIDEYNEFRDQLALRIQKCNDQFGTEVIQPLYNDRDYYLRSVDTTLLTFE